MLYGKSTVLRPWSELDLPFFSEIRNNLKLQTLLMAEPRPNSEARVAQWLRDRSDQADGVFFVIAKFSDNHAVGFIQAQRIDRRNRSAYVGICIGDAQQNRGLGAEALRLFEVYLAEVMGMRKLLLEVLTENQRAISFYRNAGFETVGTLRSHHWVRNRFDDVAVMEKLLCVGDA